MTAGGRLNECVKRVAAWLPTLPYGSERIPEQPVTAAAMTMLRIERMRECAMRGPPRSSETEVTGILRAETRNPPALLEVDEI
jgi:hypothetical protein